MMKRILQIMVFLLLCLHFPSSVHAQEIVGQKEELQVIFVMDCSGSMKSNDPMGIGRNMVEAFVDTVHAEGIRIGYVAYNDTIMSYAAPVSVADAKKRQSLKDCMESVSYAGDTDIGLGVSYAYALMQGREGKRLMVLISDGETDLKPSAGRTVAQSNLELEQCMEQCREEGIQIYTVEFGEYGGDRAVLEEIAEETGAEKYSVKRPEDLIEILYGIFQDNLFYQIRQFSSGTYAGGNQEIKCVLEDRYLDEIDVLLTSPGVVGDTVLSYGAGQAPVTKLSHYAVGKIESRMTDPSARELVINTETTGNQEIQIFVVSYRNLLPVLQIDSSITKNKEIPWRIYFRDRQGKAIEDEGFYQAFTCEIKWEDEAGPAETELKDGVFQGSRVFTGSGTYPFRLTLSDDYGTYFLESQIEVENTPPSGSMPVLEYTVLKGQTFCLDAYFEDADGDTLTYRVASKEQVETILEGNRLTVHPHTSGNHTILIQASDGETVTDYTYELYVTPLWKAYWWAIIPAALIVALILRKWFFKKTELEHLMEVKNQNRFAGRLDAYFTIQPEGRDEIPPLTFQMYKVREAKINLGGLLQEYPDAVEVLGLDTVYLIADEDRKMILYHMSKSSVMAGNSIICRQLSYSICFGDVIYITAPSGAFELELHYVAVFR